METKPDKAVSIIECDMNVRHSVLSLATVNYFVVGVSMSKVLKKGGLKFQ